MEVLLLRVCALDSVYLGEAGYTRVGLVKNALKEKLRIEKPRAGIQYEGEVILHRIK